MGHKAVLLAAIILALGVILVIGLLLKGERFTMYQEATGKTIEVKRGFSFTYLFFGPFVPLLRGHIGGFFLTLFVELASLGFARLILLFCYNGMYINWLVKNGFRRMGIENSGQKGTAPINIQINSGNVQPPPCVNRQEPAQQPVSAENITPLLHDNKSSEKYQKADSVLQPMNARQDSYDDDGETMALGGGALIGVTGMYQGAEFPLSIGETIAIGRDAEKSNLVISEREISRLHATVSYDAYNQCYQICDYSTNGVFLKDGSQLPPRQAAYLHSGDTIRLGNTAHVFRLK